MHNNNTNSILQIFTNAISLVIGAIFGGNSFFVLAQHIFNLVSNSLSVGQFRLATSIVLLLLGYGFGGLLFFWTLRFMKHNYKVEKTWASNRYKLKLFLTPCLWFFNGVLFGSGFIGSMMILLSL